MRLALSVCLVAGTVVACGGGGAGDDDWPYPIWVPTDVAVVDVDGDRRPDILTLAQFAGSQHQRTGRLVVHRQAAAGTFDANQASDFGVYPWRLATADVDGDGAVDVVVGDVDGRSVWLLLQDASRRGEFRPARQVVAGLSPYGVAIADLDGDGAPDIAATDSQPGSARLVLLYQDPGQRGSFRPPVDLDLPGSASTAIATGDLDGDARADVALGIALPPDGHTPRTAVGISLQRPDGTLGPVATYAAQDGLNLARLAIADYQGDGSNDVFAYLTPFSSSYAPTLLVMLQQPAIGRFAAPALTPVGVQGADDAVFADLDGDARPDAALCGFYPVGSPSSVAARLHRFTQSGAGHFALVSSQDLPIDASRLTAGDLDGDGRHEIVVLAGEDGYRVID